MTGCSATNLHDDGATDDVVHCAVAKRFLDIQEEVVFVRADGADEFGDVVGVEGAGLGGQAAGKVSVAHVDHTLMRREKKNVTLKRKL